MPGGTTTYSRGNVAANQLVTLPTGDVAPIVTAAAMNRAAAQRSTVRTLELTFSEAVNIDAADLSLRNLATGTAVDLSGATFSYNPAAHAAAWDLTGVALPDAYFEATLTATGITDGGGNWLAGGRNYFCRFHRLAGDANGDGSVDVGDLGILGENYTHTGNWWELPGDMNADGEVNVGDLGILGENYNTTLNPPGGGLAGEPGTSLAPAVAGGASSPDQSVPFGAIQPPQTAEPMSQPLAATGVMAASVADPPAGPSAMPPSASLLAGLDATPPADVGTVFAEDPPAGTDALADLKGIDLSL
jgi:hypothetical protein